MGIVRRTLAVGFVVILLVLSLMLLFIDERHVFLLGYHAREDFHQLKECWVDAYQSKSGVDVMWEVFWSLPPAFLGRMSYTLSRWGIKGYLDVKDLGCIEDRLLYTFYTLFTDPVHHLYEPVDEWWPETDPITGELVTETEAE